MFHCHNIPYTLHTVKIEVNRCTCVNVHILVFLQYIGILFLRYGMSVCRYIIFLLDINTGMTKIPSFRFYCGSVSLQ